MARGHPPPHCENTQVLREAITEDDDDDDDPRGAVSWSAVGESDCGIS